MKYDSRGNAILEVPWGAVNEKPWDDDNFGARNIPQNPQPSSYTVEFEDRGGGVLHASGAGSGDTYTIPSNAVTPYATGTVIVFTNLDDDPVGIDIDSDTMYMMGSETVGPFILLKNGVAVAFKAAATVWLIAGRGLQVAP